MTYKPYTHLLTMQPDLLAAREYKMVSVFCFYSARAFEAPTTDLGPATLAFHTPQCNKRLLSGGGGECVSFVSEHFNCILTVLNA